MASRGGADLNLQPVIAGIGVAEVLLTWRWHRSGSIVTAIRDQRP